MRNRSIFASVAFGIGILVGIGIMTAMSLIEDDPTAPAPWHEPERLTVERLASLCTPCEPGKPCSLAAPMQVGFCYGVVSGVEDSRPEIGRLCLPAGWNSDRTIKLFLAWTGQHPGSKGMPASDGLARALASSFDCRKSGGGV